MKKQLLALALLSGLTAPAIAAPDYAVIHLDIAVNASAAKTWATVGADYCAIAKWSPLKCAITAGSGDVGTNRRINDKFDELLVAKTEYSYTYAQPTSPIFYHGTLEVRPVDATHSHIYYTLMYDQAPLATPEAQAANRKSRTDSFQGFIETMKKMAEAK